MTVSYTNVAGVSGSGVSGSGVVYAAAGASAVGWNPGDAGSGIVIASNNLSLSSTAGANWRAVRAYAHAQNAKKYYEVRIDQAASMFNLIVGVGTAAATLTDYLGSGTTGWGIQGSGSKTNNGVVGYAATFSVGAIIGIYLDMTTNPGKLYFHLGGLPVDGAAPLGNAAFSNITYGVDFYPMAAIYNANTAVTARFASSDWTYTPASGFSAWV